MSDNDLHYDSDEYHEDSYHDFHRDDSLPDIVLSSSTVCDPDPDLLEPPADLENEYFSTNDQVVTSMSSSNGSIRVKYTDHEKPYITHRISSCTDKYTSYFTLTVPSDDEEAEEALNDEFKSLSPENQELQRLEWIRELEDLNEEMLGLEETIRFKVRYAQDLKRSLGLTAWREFSKDMKVGMRKFQESPMYQRVEAEVANIAVKVEEEATKVKSFASEEMRRASVKTSENFVIAHRRMSEKLQKIGIIEPPKEYRKEYSKSILNTSSSPDHSNNKHQS